MDSPATHSSPMRLDAARSPGLGLDDGHAQRAHWHAATDEVVGAGCAVGQRYDDVAREGIVVKCAHRGAASRLGSGDHQRRLRQAVARIEGRGPESARCEGLGETSERGWRNGLGADERDFPGGEIEDGALLRRDLADAQVVGEVGSAGNGGAEPADRIEPEEGIPDEHRGRNDDVRNPAVGRREDAADEPHVVAGRKPEDRLRVASEVEGATDGTRVGEKIGVAQHDAFGPAGRAGGVLDHRQRIGVRIVLGPAVGMDVGELVGRNPADRCGPTADCLHIGDGGGGAEHQGCSGVADERVEAIERSCPGRVDGHGDTAGVERTEKGGDELKAGRVGKHDIPTREPHVLKVHGDGAGAPVQLCVSQRRLRRIAIEQVHECDVVGAFRGKFAQAADDVPETRSRVGLGPRRDPDRGRSLAPQQRNASRT